jgi:hypothetical protein
VRPEVTRGRRALAWLGLVELDSGPEPSRPSKTVYVVALCAYYFMAMFVASRVWVHHVPLWVAALCLVPSVALAYTTEWLYGRLKRRAARDSTGAPDS